MGTSAEKCTTGPRHSEAMTRAEAPPVADTPQMADAWLDWSIWPEDPALSQTDAAERVALKGVPPSAPSLREATVLVIGLGAVGARAFSRLAQSGVGTLIGVDMDRYGPDSWTTQPICRGTDVGRFKAEVQGQRAHAINPGTRVITARGLAQHLPMWVFSRADEILIAADNLEVLVWAGTRAIEVGKRLTQGAVHGESWLALVRSYDLDHPDHPCPACGLGQREWSMLRSRIGCDPQLPREQGDEPTRTLPVICAATGELLAAEALKRHFGMDDRALASEELAYCLLSHKVWRTGLLRNPDCRCPHARWQLVDVAAPPDRVTLTALADGLPGRGPRQIRGELPWVSFTLCGGCQPGRIPVRRFGRPGDVVGRCRCGEPLVVTPVGVRSVVPPEDLRRSQDLPLSQLGLPPGGAVGITTSQGWTYFLVGQPELIADKSYPARRKEPDCHE